MRFIKNENVLTLFFEGEVNSYNSENIDKEINEIIKNNTFDKLILDFSNLRYISSAGLRVVLKLKQKYNDVHVAECSLEVYDILSMTGFTTIMDVKKAYRRVYISGAQVIGEGFYSIVYRIDKDTIIKVFTHVDDEEQIERELKLAKEAFVLGIPTAISFDIVKVDDKYGVCYEMLDCDSLKNSVVKHPERIHEYLEKYAALLKKINTTECDSPIVPPIKKKYIKQLTQIENVLPQDLYEKAYKMLDALPERKTFIHGDCHFKNIMVQNDELLLIDMDTLSTGHPIFELAAIYSAYVAFNEDNPEDSVKFFGVSAEDALKLYNALIDQYFGKDDLASKEKIQLLSYIHMLRWFVIKDPDNKHAIELFKTKLINLLGKYDNLDIGV